MKFYSKLKLTMWKPNLENRDFRDLVMLNPPDPDDPSISIMRLGGFAGPPARKHQNI